MNGWKNERMGSSMLTSSTDFSDSCWLQKEIPWDINFTCVCSISLLAMPPPPLPHPISFSIPVEPQMKGAPPLPQFFLWDTSLSRAWGWRRGSLEQFQSPSCTASGLKFRIHLHLDLYFYLAYDPKWGEIGRLQINCSLGREMSPLEHWGGKAIM